MESTQNQCNNVTVEFISVPLQFIYSCGHRRAVAGHLIAFRSRAQQTLNTSTKLNMAMDRNTDYNLTGKLKVKHHELITDS